METYLLDTNVISDMATPGNDNHVSCIARLRAATTTGARVLLPVVGVAEIEFGLQKGGKPDSEDARKIRTFLSGYMHVPFDDDTVSPYALIRAKILALHPQPKKRRLPEEWTDGTDRITGKELGIDERDLLIASAAVQFNCVLVTDDNNPGMRHIRKAADALFADGYPTRLRVENWRRAPQPFSTSPN